MSVCVECRYDNEYVDINPYICYQCKTRKQAWGDPTPKAVSTVPPAAAKYSKSAAVSGARRVTQGDIIARIDPVSGKRDRYIAKNPVVSRTRFIISCSPLYGAGDEMRPQVEKSNMGKSVFDNTPGKPFWCHEDGARIYYYFAP